MRVLEGLIWKAMREERNKEISRRSMLIGSNIKILFNIAKDSFNNKTLSMEYLIQDGY